MPPLPSPPTPTVADVSRIAALTDPVIRNLQITACYHELALALTERTGICANWCTFATWASKQAGQTIRKEDFARTLEAVIRSTFSAQDVESVSASVQAFGSPRTDDEIEESVADILNPLAAFDRAAAAVARGNKKVFEEIGYEFARFCASCLKDTEFSAINIAAFCESLLPGDPPDGQRYLRQAFNRYYQAFFEANPKTRAEVMLLANVEIGLHEQTRLQPEIAEAMNAALIDGRQFRRRLLRALFPYHGWLARLRLIVLRLIERPSPFDAVLDQLVTTARERARLLITEYLMVLTLPGERRLHLGEDLTAPFPPLLQQITLSDLYTLLATFDPTPDSTTGTGTIDWSRLTDRIHFIADMFRCYHDSADLFDAPFTPYQLAVLQAGRLPDGQL